MMVRIRFWKQMTPVLSIFASVKSLCSIDVNTLCLRTNLQSCSPVLHWGVMVLLLWDWNVVASLRKPRNNGLQKLIAWVGLLSLRAEQMISWLLGTTLFFPGTSSIFMKLPLVTYPSNMFHIIANRFRTQTWQMQAISFNVYSKSSSTNRFLKTAKGSEGTFQNSTQQTSNWMDGKLFVIACV